MQVWCFCIRGEDYLMEIRKWKFWMIGNDKFSKLEKSGKIITPGSFVEPGPYCLKLM